MGHARALSKLNDETTINNLADRVIAEALTVRELEKLIAEENLPKKNKIERKKDERNIHYIIYEKIMREKLGTKVKIKSNKLEIPFDREKDLERILEILGIEITGD